MKYIALIYFVFANIQLAKAVPAYPKRIRITVDNETIFLSLRGDEFCKYAVDEDGYSLLHTGDKWVYAMQDADGSVVASAYSPLPKGKQSGPLRDFLRSQPKGLVPVAHAMERRNAQKAGIKDDANGHVTGKRKVLVILMQFVDRKLTKTKDDFQRLFNEEGYHEDGAIGSVRDYYDYVSYGQLHLQSDILGPYTSKYMMAYYGGNGSLGGGDRNPYALFEEALSHATQEIDLADYDADGDGYVDNIHIIYAGYGEEAGASANAIWAHEMTFQTITVQGMNINKYSCAPELRDNFGNGISRIGPHCHEIGHALGAMDYYDTDYDAGGYYQGTGQWDIMASGSWNNDGICPANFNPYVKVYDFGWTTVNELQAGERNSIGASSEKGNIYRIDTGTDGDFYLLENRRKVLFDAHVPGNGMLIFHIGNRLADKSLRNTINSSYPQSCYPVCASSVFSRPTASAQSYGEINSAGCPYPGSSGNTSFSDSSTPAALTIDGGKTGINLSDIRQEDENITFYCANEDSSQPEEPEDDGPLIWSENFERLTLSAFWTYEDLEGNASFGIIKKIMEDDTPKSPKAASGQGFARHFCKGTNLLQNKSTHGRLTGGSIALNKDKSHILSFKVRKYAPKEGTRDSIKVSTDGNDSHEYSVNTQEEWETIIIPLGPSAMMCRPTFEFITDKKTILFIDDIRLIEDTSGTSETRSIPWGDKPFHIFDLTGLPVSRKRGLLILQDENGMRRKVLIK